MAIPNSACRNIKNTKGHTIGQCLNVRYQDCLGWFEDDTTVCSRYSNDAEARRALESRDGCGLCQLNVGGRFVAGRNKEGTFYPW